MVYYRQNSGLGYVKLVFGEREKSSSRSAISCDSHESGEAAECCSGQGQGASHRPDGPRVHAGVTTEKRYGTEFAASLVLECTKEIITKKIGIVGPIRYLWCGRFRNNP